MKKLSSLLNLSGRAVRRGFTLVELVVVVTIVSVLATIAVYSVRTYILHAKSVEGREMLASIMAGQESYKDETFQYLDITDGAFYPSDTDFDGTVKIQWGEANGCTNASSAGGVECVNAFNTIGVAPNAPVLFRYMCSAAASGSPSGMRVEMQSDPLSTVGTQTDWFFVAEAASALDGDTSTKTVFLGSSFSTEIFDENIGQ